MIEHDDRYTDTHKAYGGETTPRSIALKLQGHLWHPVSVPMVLK